MRLFNNKKSPLRIFRETQKYPVEPVFSLGGKTFFAFTDINNQPAGRTLAALPLYIELKTNCDENYLTAFVAGMEAVLNDPTRISIEKLIVLKNQIKDRLQWAFTPDLVYKYASVIYFDEQENPTTYDAAYADKKIAFWKEHMTTQDFFLTEPITRLIPALNAVKSSFPIYSGIILKAQALQLDQLLDILSTSRTSTEDALKLNSVISTLKELYSSDHYPLTNISSSFPNSFKELKK